MHLPRILSLAVTFGLVSALPTEQNDALAERDNLIVDAALSLKGAINSVVAGLDKADSQYMQQITMAYQGLNRKNGNNGNLIWIGNDGPNTFTIQNKAQTSTILVVWYEPDGDHQSSCMSARQPWISYTMKAGSPLTISLKSGISGGLSTIYPGTTKLNHAGQIAETWIEFTSGDDATVDVTRIVNKNGQKMSAKVKGTGCVTNMEVCSFQCKDSSRDWCGEHLEVELKDCEPGSQDGANVSYPNGDPQGGCKGWTNGGHVDISVGGEVYQRGG
ncbi:hypothetical protein F4778DRAFT_737306 [Xylariomycetidae sp. FL2044]|nr:hypothetical protein F4778DRAFT_737306 [Xylariomycetidae sp. FL2044]